MMSAIIANRHEENVQEMSEVKAIEKQNNPSGCNITVTDTSNKCVHQDGSINRSNVGELVTEIVNKVRETGKSTIKIQIEINSE